MCCYSSNFLIFIQNTHIHQNVLLFILFIFIFIYNIPIFIQNVEHDKFLINSKINYELYFQFLENICFKGSEPTMWL
jgi:hypothetical protein